ncbi:LA_2272 family surface repeat-containing protein [Flavobacterium sp.]|uniref:LA_2272 family surface repeat-containing protein n=1 Tax=Flavobacterium sp. TaxID=239 RepID=UPI0040339266
MKTKLSLLFLLLSAAGFAQGRAQVFSFTPLSQNVVEVNGLALGVGHWFGSPNGATINGINIEINPVSPFFILFQDPSRGARSGESSVDVNGLHLAVGGFSGNGSVNGLGISLYNIGYGCNGVSLTGLYNAGDTLNGLHISGLANIADNGVGVIISPFNVADQFTGVQVGLSNYSESFTGVQIGLFNRTKEQSGLQVGLWNRNGKRSLPFVNW